MTEGEMVGWYHQLDGHEVEQALETGDGQGGLACCSPWSCKESHATEQTEHQGKNTGVGGRFLPSGPSQGRVQTHTSCLAGRFAEPPGKPFIYNIL